MAVAEMKKTYLVAHQSLKPKFIAVLQEEGLLHITNLREEVAETGLEAVLADYQTSSKETELTLSQIDFALGFLNKFEQKKGFLASLIREKADVSQRRYSKIQEKVNFKDVYTRCEELDTEFNTVQNKTSQLATVRQSLLPWASLDISLEDLGKTNQTQVVIGEIPPSNLSALASQLEEEALDISIEVVNQDSRTAYVCLVFMIGQEDKVYSILHKQGFRQVSFTGLNRTPKEEVKQIEKQQEDLGRKHDGLVKKAEKLLRYVPDLLILQDFLRNERERVEIERNFAQTEQAFMIEGWVRAANAEKLSKRLANMSKEASVSFTEPTLDDAPPTVLENKNWLKPFEIVTRLYGTPNYRELDPTPYMAPFFLIFFGLCIGDVGYGLVLILASWFLKKKLPVSATVKNFFTLLIYGGFTSVIAGAATGSWFAVETKQLPSILKIIIVFEPLKQPVIFLVFAIILGFVQLWFGILLELYDNIKRGKAIDALLKQGAKLIFLPGVALLIAWFLTGGKGEAPSWLPMAKWLAIAGALMIILFSNRESKNWLARIGGGMYNLYGMSSFLGDTISYARLMALGLATFLIGWAFNIIGSLVFNGIATLGGTIPGFLIMIMLFVGFGVIFIGLHVFNLLINLISAFVHPARLQYVEFFSKFFDGGGKKYKPFAIETKNLNIK